jgi:uncharacterized protein YcbK (DUF882 family)
MFNAASADPQAQAQTAVATEPCAGRAVAAAPPRATPATVNRRRAVRAAVAGAALAALAPAGSRSLRSLLPDADLWHRPRMLWVTRPQAQEAVRVVYWADGAVQPDGYAALNRIYRDLHANVQRPIALGLFDLNFVMQAAVNHLIGPRPLILFSGYRTAITNARVGGIEPNIHGLGLADDYHYEGLSLLENYHLAKRFQVGGLGLYPDRASLHKDIGRFRSWVTPGHQPGAGGEHASFR